MKRRGVANMLWGNVKTPTDIKKVQELIDNTVTLLNPNTPSRYPYVAFASDANGTDFSKVFKDDLTYAAILVSDTLLDWADLTAADFEGLWFPIGSWIDGMISAKIIPIMSVDGHQSVCNCPFFLFLKGDEEMPDSKSIYSTKWDGWKGWQTVQQLNCLTVYQAAHGFTGGEPVYNNGGTWELADANNIDHACQGFVIPAYVSPNFDLSANVFGVVSFGFFAGDFGEGVRYCLSTTPGQIVDEATALAYADGKVIQYLGTGATDYQWNGGATPQQREVAGMLVCIERGKVKGATTQVQSDWNQATNTEPDFIKNKPNIPAAQVNADWNASGTIAEILNKPNIPAEQVNSDWNATSGKAQILNKPTIPEAYTLPNASDTVLGGIKVGTNLSIDGNGVLSASGGAGADEKVKYDAGDTAAGYLSEKVAAGANIAITEGTGADENKVKIAVTGLHAVATSGSYNDLGDKPTIPAAQIQSDWNQTNDTALDFIKNKPTIPAADNSVEIYIDFLDTTAFVFTAPYAMKFTAQTSEGADATLSPVLNTDLAQYDDVTITPAEAGLIILTGEML